MLSETEASKPFNNYHKTLKNDEFIYKFKLHPMQNETGINIVPSALP